jgi:uncharacterized protein YktB (UPF0637 family)
MDFAGWTQDDFEVFGITGFDKRMEMIRERIQPKLDALGRDLVALLQPETGTEWFHHVAKHIRRSVNPPLDTWVGINRIKRGYKATIHFGVGLSSLGANVCLVVKAECVEREAFATGIERGVGVIRPLLAASPALYIGDVPNAPLAELLPAREFSTEEWLKRADWLRHKKLYEFEMGRRFEMEQSISMGPDLVKATLGGIREMLPLYQAGIKPR